MTDLRKAAEMAIEAFEDIKKYVTDDGAMPENWDAYHEKEYYALEALRTALAQPEQEPWVSLTDEEIADAVGSPIDEVYLVDFRKVEAALRSKNT